MRWDQIGEEDLDNIPEKRRVAVTFEFDYETYSGQKLHRESAADPDLIERQRWQDRSGSSGRHREGS